MESDLKTMIKKLQRLRDQIRTWIQSNEIKDKNALLDNRRLIETQMEKFKAVEKEMKTKAFSKEGLAAAKLDPAERAKLDATNWLANHVDELAHQVEAAEAEVEQLSASTKKTRKGGHNKDERIASLETHNEARRYHINRLELVLRIVENGTLEPESIDDIKDEVDYFVEKNSEEDMTDYEGIYDQFNLDEEEEKFGLKDTEDGGSSHESASVVDEPVSKPKKREEEPKPEPPTPAKDKRSKKKSTKEKETKDKESKEPPKPVKDEIPESDKTVVPPANFTKPAAAGVSPPKPAATPNLPPIRYATAAAAAMGPNSSHPSGVAFGDEASEPAGHRGSIVSQTPTAASAEPPSPSQDVPLAPPGLASSASKDVDTVTDQLAQTHVEDNSVPARQMPPVLVGLAGNLDQVKQSCTLGIFLRIMRLTVPKLCWEMHQGKTWCARSREAPLLCLMQWTATSRRCMSRKACIQRRRTIRSYLFQSSTHPSCTARWMSTHSFSSFTINRGHITGTLPRGSSSGRAGVSTRSISPGFSDTRSRAKLRMSTKWGRTSTLTGKEAGSRGGKRTSGTSTLLARSRVPY